MLLSSQSLRSPRVLTAAIALMSLLSACTTGVRSDRAWWRDGADEARYGEDADDPVDDVERTSRYLTMRDGTRIAIDLHLPADRPAGERLPTILMQTRYYRRAALNWPFSWMADGHWWVIERFVRRGYAWVAVDVRGTGASFGTRTQPFAEAELADGTEIVDWIIAQPWSDGAVGAFGISYVGTTAELLLAQGHPAVKAIAPIAAYFDAYPDIVRPGGLWLEFFTRRWGTMNELLDGGRPEEAFTGIRAAAVAGPAPVDDDPDGALLAAALAEHAGNADPHDLAALIEHRDAVSPDGLSVDGISPHADIDALRASGAPIYSISGWFDGAYVHGAAKRYLAVPNPGSRLTLGPWDHGARQNISPHADDRDPDFDLAAELLRFFDRHLKGVANGLADEPPVHYFTMAEERWKSAPTWPPPGFEPRAWHLAPRGRLAPAPPATAGADDYAVDAAAGTGVTTRWESLANPNRVPIVYPDRAERAARLQVYDAAPLAADVEVTGHPVVHLWLRADATDAAVFAYLEDVAPDGEVTYVTEGMLRAAHRHLPDGAPPFPSPSLHRDYLAADARPLTPGEATELVFDLLPTSYLFRAGHRVRLAFAGADADHFAQPPDAARKLQLLFGPTTPSRVILPSAPVGPDPAPDP